MKNILLCAAIAAAATMTSCLDSKAPLWKTNYYVVIINQGDSAQNNGSIDFYQEEEMQYTKNIISPEKINATIRSATFTNGGNLWLACNNPDKVAVCDVSTLRCNDTIVTDSLLQPVHAVIASHELSLWLFVSSKGAPDASGAYPNGYITLHELTGFGSDVSMRGFHFKQKITGIPDAANMLVVGNKLYAACADGLRVYDISATTSMTNAPAIIPKPSACTGNARQFVITASDKVWVSYSDGTLQNINIANATEERFFGGIPMESSGDMALAADGSNIITYLNQRDAAGDTATIYSINLDDGAATAVYGGRHVLRGVGASARTGNIYAADTAAMFIVRDGAKGAAHSTGLRPRQFLFFVQNTKLD